MRWLLCLTLLFVCAVPSMAGLLLSYGGMYPSGAWAADRYHNGVSYGLSGEWPIESHVIIVLPVLSYSDLGVDGMLPAFILRNYGTDLSDIGEIRSNLWYAGAGLKGVIFPKAIVTPTVGVGYAYFNRGVTVKGVPLPTIPDVPGIPTNFNAGGGGFLLTYGVKLINSFNLSLDLEFRNYWAKKVGSSEVEKFLGMPERGATGLHLMGSLELM
jgi:hypothetical protein